MHKSSLYSICIFHKLSIFDQGCPNLARWTQADPRRDPGGRFRIFDKMCIFFPRFYRKMTSKVAQYAVHYLLASIYGLNPEVKFGDFRWIFENLVNNRFFSGKFYTFSAKWSVFTRVFRVFFTESCSKLSKIVQNCPN